MNNRKRRKCQALETRIRKGRGAMALKGEWEGWEEKRKVEGKENKARLQPMMGTLIRHRIATEAIVRHILCCTSLTD